MNEKVKNVIFAIGEVFSALFTAINLILSILGYFPNYDARIFALIGLAVFVSLVIWHISRLSNKLESSSPNIQLDGNPHPHDIKIKNGSIIHIANVPFSNNPKFLTPNNSADKVLAHIEYLDEQKKVLFKLKPGRWTDTKLPYDLSDCEHHGIQHIDFPNTGAIRWLELLVKYPEDEFCYGFNNAAVKASEFWLNPEFKISMKRFFVRVELRGNYLRKNTFVFEVTTKGKGDTFRIR